MCLINYNVIGLIALAHMRDRAVDVRVGTTTPADRVVRGFVVVVEDVVEHACLAHTVIVQQVVIHAGTALCAARVLESWFTAEHELLRSTYRIRTPIGGGT